jgi:hypothetical protein
MATHKLNRFPGLFTNADSADLPLGGGQVQDNCYARKAGQLTPRRGLRQIVFDNLPGGTADANDVIGVASMTTPNAYFVVFQNVGGKVRVGKQPL